MNNYFFVSLLMWIPLFSPAMTTETVCTPQGPTTIEAGPSTGSISQIHSLKISFSEALPSPQIFMSVEGLDSLGKKVSGIEAYELKDMKSGTLLELQGSPSNIFEFDAIFLELGAPEVETAGPIPTGTFALKASMAFIDSNVFYLNPYPMALSRVNFDCQQTVRY
ncbi:MAG: hypothetical protein OM95_03505 [Bdellovibrio sp. ArHS]|uniref:hypothetical protein n=1 Tax=Bdellovibrio sp. ArHS TaxID=1569284 RepID=UPI000582C0C2|nr:hypothetical protein [Bdellovibrio sp. ArHS]KHD89442.1 MAG: hypothetical protein OM95_03505 [Bdellovibrio sp. ArHS]